MEDAAVRLCKRCAFCQARAFNPREEHADEASDGDTKRLLRSKCTENRRFVKRPRGSGCRFVAPEGRQRELAFVRRVLSDRDARSVCHGEMPQRRNVPRRAASANRPPTRLIYLLSRYGCGGFDG